MSGARALPVCLTVAAAAIIGCGGGSSPANNPALTGGSSGSGGTSGTTGGTAGGSGGAAGTATGGSGGNVMRPPIVIHSCDELPPIGQWEEATPPAIRDTLTGDGIGVVSVAVDPLDPATVYVAGGDQACCGKSQGIWKSTDCGSTWTKANTGALGAELDTGFAWGLMQIDTEDSQRIHVVNGYGSPATLFKSTNGGKDWAHAYGQEITKYLTQNFVSIVAMDPAQPKHMVVSFHENCVGDLAPMCMAETTDGENWRAFKGPGDGWLEGAGPVVLGPTSFLYAAPFTGLFYTNDNGATWEKVAGDAFYQMHKAADGSMYLGSAQAGILRSVDGRKWDKIPNTFPATGVIGDGERIFASFQQDSSGQPYYFATEADPMTWKKMDSPQIKSGGSVLAYDKKHMILYSANYNAGMWRVVTRQAAP